MFFPEILNRVTEYTNKNVSNAFTICEAVNANITHGYFNESSLATTAVKKLEFATYEYTFLLEIIYAVGFGIIGVLVNRIGKLLIIVSILSVCAICGIIISFFKIISLGIYLYVILLACGLVVNVINTSTIELFPTNLR
jgi:MFS family permease